MHQGYAATLGADYIQYMVADATSVPPGYEDHFTEKLILMPHQVVPVLSTRTVTR